MRNTTLLAFTAVLLLSCGGKTPQEPEDGFPTAAEIALTDVDGYPQILSSFKGKVVVLNFFATWCGPCQDEMPRLEANIWRVYRDRNLAVLGIDLQEDIGAVKLFAVNNGLTFPLAIDQSGAAFRAYAGGDAVTNVPFNVIIDRDQQIRYSRAGYNESQMIQMIEELLR